MKNVSERFSFFKNPKLFTILGFLVILLAIPITISQLQVSTKQVVRQNASYTGDLQDSCGNLKVDFLGESPNACLSNSYQASMTSHNSSARLTLTHDISGSIIVDWISESHWCATRGNLTGSSCLDNPHAQQGQCTISNGSRTCVIPATGLQSGGPYTGQACGYYQDDFAFNYHAGSYGGQGCHYGSYNDVKNSPGGATYCNAGDCHNPTPTPQATSTPVPPTNTPGPTSTPVPPTSTPLPTETPVPTATSTPFPTDTPFPSGTPSPTSTPNPSATPTPTNTPGATNTPNPQVFVTNTPKPTLPPTGPENNSILLAGFAGIAIAVIGSALFFGL